MSFLTPAFLVGISALAIPVLIHLIQRERKRVVVFPSLMFLRRIPYQSVRRRSIRHWLLLSLRALAREDPFRVYGLEQRRAFCHVADAVEAMTRLMAAPAAAGRIVNIGNDAEETPIERLLSLVLRIAGFAPRIEGLPAPAGSPPRRCPDIARLRALTGFAPKIDLESGVRQTFEWYRDRSGAPRSSR